LNFFSFFNLDFINFKYVSYLNKLVIIFLLFFFSIISYFLIEKKFRGSYCNFKNLVKIILLFYIIIIGFTLAVIYKDGFINRLPELFKKNTFEFYPPQFNLLKDTNGITCLNKLSSCQFNITAKDKIFLIGDSHMLSLSYNLKDRVVDLNYQFIVKSIDSMCIFKDNREICKESIIFDKKKDEKSIIILGGDINDEVEKLKNFEKEFFIKKLEELSKNNKIILVYPIPNPKTDVPSSLFRILSKKKNLEIDDYITTSFLDYKKETKSTFYLLDKIKNENIYRVYPHKLFCNTIIKNKCIANNNVSIFYSDNNHPSKKAAEMINDLIIMIIKKPSNIYF
jgi:hypothetical protein